MSREIKFRAWQETHDKKGQIIHDYLTLNRKNHFSASDLTNNLQGDIISVMQFTGLKDKNGVEIYEGDLVKHNHWDYHLHIIFDTNRSRFVVKLKTGLTIGILSEEIKIIGNIYENPELLADG